MKIVNVEHYIIHPTKAAETSYHNYAKGKNLCFVKIETDEGIDGWGECYTQADRDIQVTAHIDQLKRYLIGRDPRHIKHFLQMSFDDFGARRGAMDLYSAVSGLEQAMWDILGKSCGLPVHMLLGGPCRDKIRVYANGWGGGGWDETEVAEKARKIVDLGFTALKFDPVPGPWRTFVDKTIERQTIKNVQAVREAVGPDIDILVEMHRRLAPMHAVRIAREMEQFEPFWYEKPVLAENINALAAAKKEINIPDVTGDEL